MALWLCCGSVTDRLHCSIFIQYRLGIELQVLALESVDGDWNVVTDSAVAEKERDTGMIRKVVSVCDFGILFGL